MSRNVRDVLMASAVDARLRLAGRQREIAGLPECSDIMPVVSGATRHSDGGTGCSDVAARARSEHPPVQSLSMASRLS